MRRLSERPIVSFARNGEVFELGRSGTSRILHMYGSTGLGIAPVEIESSPRIAGDGSIVRGVRYGDREVYIPLRMEADTTADLSLLRRRLSRILAPTPGDPVGSVVAVTVNDPATGSERTVRGIYKDGLTGDFGSGYNGYFQKLGITFECHDPWWLGPERLRTLRLNPGTKPFLSQTEPFFPMVLAPSNVIGTWDIDVAGDTEVWPSWEVTGPGRDLKIQRGKDRILIRGDFPSTPTLIQTRPRRITPIERWTDTSRDSTLFSLKQGANRIKVEMTGASAETTVRLVYRERYLEGL